MAKLSISALLLAGIVSFSTLPAMADGGVRTCSLQKVLECLPDEDCEEMSVQDMALPRFVRIDLDAKTITSLDKDVPRTSQIASIDRVEGEIIMHGNERRGWTMTLGEDSGDFTLAAAGDGEGFIVFGSCITPGE